MIRVTQTDYYPASNGVSLVRFQDQVSADASIVANLQVMPSHNQPLHSDSPRSLSFMGSQLETTN